MLSRSLVDQLLKSGQSLLNNNAPNKSSSSSSLNSMTDLLGGAGGSALAAGALGLLLGSNKTVRKTGGKVLTYGSLAALGVVAYKAYGNWQTQQAQGTNPAPITPPQTIDRLPAPQAEQHSLAILRALIAAAKADGHVDARERQLIEEAFAKINSDPQLQSWLRSELEKPLDPAEVARGIASPELAAELYLASMMMVDEEQFMERAYLDELARQLALAPSLKQELELQMQESRRAAVASI